MEKCVITIARETGSGGHNITRKLSAALGIPYYDRELLQLASDVSGIHEGLFGMADERIGVKEMLFAARHAYDGEPLRTATTMYPRRTCSVSRRKSSGSWPHRAAALFWAVAPIIC